MVQFNVNNVLGFNSTGINLDDMTPQEVKKVILIGDGMSGKTQILLTFGRLVIEYLREIYEKTRFVSYSNQSSADTDELDAARAVLEGRDRSQIITPNFKAWAERYGFSAKYGRIKWDFSSVSLDTETIGMESFSFAFPYVWQNKTYRIHLTGNDVGGQNIFDHFRNVLSKMATSDDYIVVIFDKSRSISCWNSVDHVKGIISDRNQRSSRVIPKIIYVGNKIDLEQHVKREKWHYDLVAELMRKMFHIVRTGKGTYKLPSLVGNIDQERKISFELSNDNITFPDLEVLLYNAIRVSDEFYGKFMTDVNAKALGREIASQLVVNYKSTSGGSDTIMDEFGKLLFQRRPLAMQYSGGIEMGSFSEEDDPLVRVRNKWINFAVSKDFLFEANIETAINGAVSADEFLSELPDIYNTNALLGTGVLEVMGSIIENCLKKNSQKGEDKPKKRKIKRF